MSAERLPLTAFIVCKDEEQYIGNCLQSLDICAEIIVVDSGSKDGTAKVVRALQAEGWPIRWFHQDWLGYAGQKQFALDQATQPWCFNIDADERLDEALKRVMPELLAAPPNVAGWRVVRRPYLLGYGYPPSSVSERANFRLVRRGKGRYDLTQKVHEGMLAEGLVKDAPSGSILHYRPLLITEQIGKLGNYASLKADQVAAKGSRPRYARLVINPFVYFFRLFVLHRFYRCGWAGFIEAVSGSVYSFLTEALIFQRAAAAALPPFDNLDRPGGGAGPSGEEAERPGPGEMD